MRRITVILILLFLTVASASAQLNVDRMFGGTYCNDPSVSEVVITGAQAKAIDKGLTRVVVFKGNAVRFGPIISKLVNADARKASGRDIRYTGGKMSYAYIAVDGQGRKTTYIYYVGDAGKASDRRVLLVILEGTLSAKRQAEVIRKIGK